MVGTALLLPILLGFASLALDVSTWRAAKQRMQIGTDAAAIAGAYILREDSYTTADIEAVVAESMAMSGVDASAGALTQVAVTAGGQAVQVTMSRPLELFLSSAFLSEAPRVSVVSEARLVTNVEPVCLVALEPSKGKALEVKSQSTIDADACEVRVNSTKMNALAASDGALISTARTCVTGGVNNDGATFSPSPETGCSPIADPMADVAEPDVGACDYTDAITLDGGTHTLSPGVYCANIKLDNGAAVQLDPGIYVLKDARLTVDGNSSIQGDGVALYLVSDGKKGAKADLNFELGGTITLSAPMSGPLAGIVVFESRSVAARSHVLKQGSQIVMDGKIYLPNSELVIKGGSSGEVQNPFEMVVANKIVIKDNSEVSFKGGSAEDIGEDGFKVALSK